MQFAFHLHALRHHWQRSMPSSIELERDLRRIRDAGFDGVDVSDSWPFDDFTVENAHTVRCAAESLGLRIPTVSCMGKTLCHPELAERNARAVEAAFAVAERLGAGIVNLALSIPRTPGVTPVMGATHSPGGSRGATDADFDQTAERLRTLAQRAADCGLSLSIELHDRSLADTSASLLRLLNATGAPNVGANPDLCNGYRAYDTPPETWREALSTLAPRMNLWHVNNLQRVHFPELQRSAFVERPLSDGDVDYSLALRQVREAGFDGWVVIEYKGVGDAFATLRAGRAYLSACAADAALETA
ncbi:sugar phosphate isomerase/epimerase family protein [Hydrogenophaga sp. BPS33]|uniref:sugar phosphate isomerase/epimerase family protein n=1 Tax=Hydrogenophaga sp. BPS33 TaxID=2651974 RepID=UPI001357CC87|nr:sugar phosphate isomerase/epimerase family protein [Hydrogenophaga sp. BPS33]